MEEAERITNKDTGFERSDVPPRLVGFIAIGLIAVVILAVTTIRFVYPTTLYGPSDGPRLVPASPRLQNNPPADLDAFRAQEDRILTSYGWVDGAHLVVRIPIDQAMRDVAAKGIADWPGNSK